VVNADVQAVPAEVDKLRDHAERLGRHLGDGWSAARKQRTRGQLAAHWDVLFYAPDGTRYFHKAC
jgi:hypothetical protein